MDWSGEPCSFCNGHCYEDETCKVPCNHCGGSGFEPHKVVKCLPPEGEDVGDYLLHGNGFAPGPWPGDGEEGT
jgi:hypothetical protein